MRHRAGFFSADPRRVRRSAYLAAVLAAALACGCSGSKTNEVTHAGPSCSTPPASPDQPAGRLVADARRAAVTYVRLIAGHRYDSAEAAILPCSPADKRSLLRLWKFMAGMPAGGARVNAETTRINRKDATATARLTIFVRFGHDPASIWVKAATRSLKLQLRGERWLVAADVTRAAGGDLAAYGFSSFSRPVFYDGSRATVVASAGADDVEARFILQVADAAVPEIWSRLGDGKAARRPLIFLVESKRQGERLAHIDLGKVRTPAGWQYSAFTYVDMPEWEQLDEDSQQSMVVHELTHVATRSWLSGAPHSLVEGVAMYEEDRWRRDHRIWPIPMTGWPTSMRAWTASSSGSGDGPTGGCAICSASTTPISTPWRWCRPSSTGTAAWTPFAGWPPPCPDAGRARGSHRTIFVRLSCPRSGSRSSRL